MALIEIYHVVADMYPVADSQTIREGMAISLNTDGEAEAANATDVVFGIAGDNTASSSTDANKATPYSANLTIGASGASQKWTENRVSDAYNETLASGKMTVYTGGGKFATDQYAAVTFAVGEGLYSDANGLLTNVDGGGSVVGTVVATPTAYPSGVPGTDTTDGSLSLGTFLTFILNVAPIV